MTSTSTLISTSTSEAISDKLVSPSQTTFINIIDQNQIFSSYISIPDQNQIFSASISIPDQNQIFSASMATYLTDQDLNFTFEIPFENIDSFEVKTSSTIHPPPDSSFPLTDELNILKLEVNIMHEVENQGFEDGFQHPAENLIFEYSNLYPALMKRWLQQTFLRNYQHPEIIIAILKTITHFDISYIDPECKILSVAALSHKNPEVREAAISVFEAWGTPDGIVYLQNYNETKPWLRQYRDKIIQELEERNAVRC